MESASANAKVREGRRVCVVGGEEGGCIVHAHGLRLKLAQAGECCWIEGVFVRENGVCLAQEGRHRLIVEATLVAEHLRGSLHRLAVGLHTPPPTAHPVQTMNTRRLDRRKDFGSHTRRSAPTIYCCAKTFRGTLFPEGQILTQFSIQIGEKGEGLCPCFTTRASPMA